MYFYKFLDEQYHPLKNPQATIRLGSFNYYRNIENSYIADRDEGMLQYALKGVTYNTGNVANNPVVDGMFVLQDGAQVKFNGINVASAFPNCLIFCCSCFREAKNQKELGDLSKRLNYCSYYQIQNIHAFAEMCAHKIKSNLNLDKLKGIEQLTLQQICGIQVGYQVSPVVYKKGVALDVLSGDESHNSLDKQIEHLFVKNEKFSKDDEYRIVFFIVLGNQILSFNDDYFDIPVNSYEKLISF